MTLRRTLLVALELACHLLLISCQLANAAITNVALDCHKLHCGFISCLDVTFTLKSNRKCCSSVISPAIQFIIMSCRYRLCPTEQRKPQADSSRQNIKRPLWYYLNTTS
uniref:Chemokine interleukin-8-like domain-containing protein n=1 Tax=Amphiprion percula TaxID=161767 RepID=A0A3P8U3L3_AMPPE